MEQLSRHYNTTHEPNKQELDRHANAQAKKILQFFKEHPGELFTPFDVQKSLRRGLIMNSPITSIRRAMTNLTDKGKLVKTKIKRPGIYKAPNYCWRLAE